MSISLSPSILKRYKDIAVLFAKYGRGDLFKDAPLIDDPLDHGPKPTTPPEASELVDDIEKMGPTFIKLGQLISTRSDIIPPAYAEAFSRLQDHVEPFPYEQVEAIVQVETGARLSKAFSEFETTPIGSASLGQVHRAVLRSGRSVVVKIQRPGIREKVAEDLQALQEAAEFLDSHSDAGRRYHFVNMIEELRKSLLDELDYRLEAANLLTLRKNLASFDLVIPEPIPDYSTGRILTMDHVTGKKVTKLSPLTRLDIDGEALAEELFKAYLHQILVDGFFHADPHPGNIFLTDEHKIALLDLGMVARIGVKMQELLLKFLIAISEGRGDQAADAAILMGTPEDDFDEPTFRRHLTDLVARQQGASVTSMQVGRIVMLATKIAADNGIRIPAELTLLGKTLLNLDIVGRTLAPDFNPTESIRRNASDIIRQRMLRQLSPGHLLNAAIETKELLEQLPKRANQFLDLLANNRVKLDVDAIDESLLMSGFQKVANRITMGIILAALILGSALLMRVETDFKMFGYPGFAILFFLAASLGSGALVISMLMTDWKAKRKKD